MIRIQACEDALPPRWRDVVRNHPALSLAAAAAAGFYLGRRHGPPLLRALAALGISVGLASAKRALGVVDEPGRRASSV